MKPTKKQQRFIDSSAKITILGGGCGAGMTTGVALAAVNDALNGKRVVVSAGNSYSTTHRYGSLRNKVDELCAPLHEVLSKKSYWSLNYKSNGGGCISMLPIEHLTEDAVKVLSFLADTIYIDNVKTVPETVLKRLITDSECTLKITTTAYVPDSTSSQYLHELITSNGGVICDKYEQLSSPNRKLYDVSYIHATVDDNPYIDDEYVKALEGLHGDTTRCLRYGEWFRS